jgi:hypothetical protein
MKIELTKARPYTCEGVVIYPGVNVVNGLDEKQRKRLLNNPGFKERLKKGILKMDGAEAVEDKEPNAKELARSIIPEMTDIETLRGYTLDKRQTIREAAEKRLKVIDEAAGGNDGKDKE